MSYYKHGKVPVTPAEIEAATPTLGNVVCRSVSPAYTLFCTRAMNHPSDHIAGDNLGRVLEQWPNENG